ncbi:MAG: RagB/SusD family nutrient uptake outer membrane protein [Bacteroides sp.]|nr:RagB/SusD family nutrient uptake outer membrane protein [Bacteroides sp.]
MISLKNILRTSAVLSAAVLMGSCVPEMDLNNPSELSIDTYYTTEAELENAIIPAYEALIGQNQGGYARGLYYNLLAPGDDYDKTFKWSNLYQDTYTTPASDDIILWSWKDMFNGVFAANLALEKITAFEGDIDEDTRNRMLGEAHFLRALHYMLLVQLFGETVPYWDHSVSDASEYYPSNAESGQIYSLIISDFSTAADLLPLRSELYANSANIGRATKGAAQAYLAKAYMYRPILERGQEAEFSKAAEQLKKVIDSGEYSLMENYRANSMWDSESENNEESIFEIQMYNGPDWMGGDKSDSWRWQEIGVPDGTGSSWWNLAPNKRTFDEFEEGDPRKYMTLWCPDGAYYTELSGNVADWDYMLEHLSSDKHLYGTRKLCPDYQLSDTDDEINDRIFRYADVLLLYAECLSETGNDSKSITDPTGPKYYIQQVRDRANNIVPTEQDHLWYHSEPGYIPNVDELLASGITINGVAMNSIKNIIVHERYVELCGEYQRYFDLLRWGMADSKWLESIEELGWSEKAMYYPFPEEELSNNPNLKGNDMN